MMIGTTLLTVRLKRYLDNHKTRSQLKKHLRGMPARELDRLAWDIGISRAELLREARSPFWKTDIRPEPQCGESFTPERFVRLL